MILYFLRHGLAGDRATWSGDDSLRPLTQQGEDRLKAQAEKMDELRLELDLVLTSPLVRALQTAQIVAKRLGLLDSLVQDQRLAPGFGVEELALILRDYTGRNNLLLVGHEPDFSETVAELTGGTRLVFKKAGLARVDLVASEPLQGELVWLIPPKIFVSE